MVGLVAPFRGFARCFLRAGTVASLPRCWRRLNHLPRLAILGEGTVLIVKEPYLKLMSNGLYGLRVDHISDVIFLPKNDNRVPDCWRLERREQDLVVNSLKAKGNDCFKTGKFHTAIDQCVPY